MTGPLPPDYVETALLPPGQSRWARAVVNGYLEALDALSPDERVLYAQIWKDLARYSSPAAVRQFPGVNRHLFVIQQMIASLRDRSLLWFDDDLRAVLQCAPFSSLVTPHQIKAFGWDRVYTTSFVDIPLTLLVYGPNVWLNAESYCPRSGEVLAFRVQMRDDGSLNIDAPSNANEWRVWLPLPEVPADDAYAQFNKARPRVSAFNTQNDLDTHRQYHGTDAGVVYTFDQSMFLSTCLLKTAKDILYTE